MPAGRIVLQKHTADRQHQRMRLLLLYVAARVRLWPTLKRTDLEGGGFEQCPAYDFHCISRRQALPRIIAPRARDTSYVSRSPIISKAKGWHLIHPIAHMVWIQTGRPLERPV